jgi:hypothetical protein
MKPLTKIMGGFCGGGGGDVRDDGNVAGKAIVVVSVLSEILQQYEEAGDAMRYLNAQGGVAWKASPRMLARLADAERAVEDDWVELR